MDCTCGMSQAVCRLLHALMTGLGQTVIMTIRYCFKPNLSLGFVVVGLFARQVEKTRYAVSQIAFLVVDECVENPCGPVQRHHVVVGDGGRDKTAVSLSHRRLFACLSYPYLEVALDTHRYDETVVFQQVAVERLRQFSHSYAEEL